ncbi:unnamed protein product, partial [Laminaria digitata]
PAVWVTRYVDYSLKYGVGFLLSDGGAGVYFNDATKIVLEPAGVSFDYIERARRSSPGSGGGSSAGHTVENFPAELQKKVTLLEHFRGYLLEKKDEGVSGAAAVAVAKTGTGVGVGAGAGEGGGGGEAVEEGGRTREPLTFLKKWLRTRNAFLFRLSNGTVQV